MSTYIYLLLHLLFLFFFFNDTATTEIYTLSLHDALPICIVDRHHLAGREIGGDAPLRVRRQTVSDPGIGEGSRSEEHTSELQSRQYLVCRLLLEKKNTTKPTKQQQHIKSLISALYSNKAR